MARKRVRILATLVLLAVGAVTAVYALTHVMRKDHTPPKITMAADHLEISASYQPRELLGGVSAWDDRDGDVTNRIVVESISDISARHTAVVTYAAFDSAGNVAKATRTLLFTDYRSPRFFQNKALVLPEGTTQDVLGFMSAEDMVEGDISGRIKGNLVSNTTSLTYAGTHEVEFRVTNSMGDTVRMTLPVDVFPVGAFNAGVELSEYLIYIPKGTDFNGEKYLKNLTVGSVSYAMDGTDSTVKVYVNQNGEADAAHVIRVEMTSKVNTDVPGIYSVTYTAVMDGVHTGYARLNVVVEE